MYKKPSSPVYANVSGAQSTNKKPTDDHKEPTYYNTLTRKMPRPQGIYSNVDYQGKPNHTYSNVAETSQPTYTNTRYPIYDNVKPLAKRNVRCPPSPVSSSYSELQKATSYDDDSNNFYNSASQTSTIYESIYEPFSDVRPVSQQSSRSRFSMSSIAPSSTIHRHRPKIDSLTELLLHSLSINRGRIPLDLCTTTSEWNCTKCNQKVMDENVGCTAMGNIYHIKCFTCTHCGDQLKGKQFFHIDNKPYCEEDYYTNLEKCYICQQPILDRILRATGRPYHANCFRCVVCSTSLDGIPFTVDAINQIYCIDDFHKKFAPRCSVCRLPIRPDVEDEEAVRFVALDRSFHIQCYRCEDCDTRLGSQAEGKGCYPLDGHLLCKSCNAKRVQILTSSIPTEI